MGHNNSGSSEISDHPLTLYSSPRRLQLLASAKIALLLWRHKIDALDTWDHLSVAWFFDQRFSCGHLLPVPSSIKDLIDDCINQMSVRVATWVDDHARTIRDVFYGCEQSKVIDKCIDCIEILNDDETIVGKLLKGKNLSAGEKYRLACKLCRRNDIELLWPLVSWNSLVTEVSFDDNAVLYYWNCSMKGITPKIPGNPDESIELRMLSYDYLYNNYAIGYFWDKLSPDECMSVVNRVLIRANECERIMLTVLPRLNDVLVRHVLSTIPGVVLTTLAPNIENSEYLARIWVHFCDLASLNEFYNVLHQIFEATFAAKRVPRGEEVGKYRISEVLYELWILSEDKFRNYVTDNHIRSIFQELDNIEFIRLPDCYHRDVRFLIDLLSKVDLSIRNEIWLEHWRSLIIRAKPIFLEQFLKLCIESHEEIVRFKEGVMMDYEEIEWEIEAFVDFGYYDELTDYINFCSTDKSRVENLRRRIISSQFVITNLLYPEKLHKFIKFIDDTFDSIELADRFKEEFLISPECEILKYLYSNLEVGRVKHMLNVRHFLSTESRTNQIKQESLKHCKGCLINAKFSEFEVNDWKAFITWCTGSKENWWAFRRSLPLTEIFDKLLTKVIKGMACLTERNADQIRYTESTQPTYEILLSFTPLDNFLLWCLVNKDIVRDYKINTLKKGSSRTLRITLQKNWGKIVDIVLLWVFDDDKKMLSEFKATWKPEQGAK